MINSVLKSPCMVLPDTLDRKTLALTVTAADITVIFTEALYAEVQVPFCTTALYHLSAVRGPISALVRVVVVFAIGIGAVKAASVLYSHCTTLPVWPLRVRSAGEDPLFIVWLLDTVPPTLALTVTVTDAVLEQPVVVLVTVKI